jgi:NAD(P)H-dependent flavin oxidoreductase YrpB (nitropropane dioxygenase family)
MQTELTKELGMTVPIFGFSHCRDVVAAVSKAGGMGVLGTTWMTPEQLEIELKWLDTHTDGKPYGVDIIFPGTFVDVAGDKDPEKILPREHRDYIAGLLDADGIPRLPADESVAFVKEYAERMNFTPTENAKFLEVALRHPVGVIVNALGIAPREVIDMIHARGLKIGALVGSTKHALKQRAAGVDFVVAQGTEAGGHAGSITSLVLWPQVIEAVSPMPVLAAGGIGRGSQMISALAMGAQGVWLGSVWLGTIESELSADIKEKLFAAQSEDARQTLAISGKPCRALRSKYTEAWEKTEGLRPLKMPLQTILGGEPTKRIERAHAKEWITYPVGQIVGEMKEQTSCRQIIQDLLLESAEASERLQKLLEG